MSGISDISAGQGGPLQSPLEGGDALPGISLPTDFNSTAALTQPDDYVEAEDKGSGLLLRNSGSRDLSAYFRSSDKAPGTALVTAVLDDFHRILHFPSDERDSIWSAALDRLECEGITVPRETIGTYERLRDLMEANGLTFEKRFHSLRNVLEILSNRESLDTLGQNRPIAVILATTIDEDHAFDWFPMVDTLVDSGRFDVVYYEASSEGEVRRILEGIHRATARTIHTLVLAGHGTASSLNLGERRSDNAAGRSREDLQLEIGDFEKGEFAFLSDLVALEGQVLLWSCSNGAGGERAVNLANTVARSLPGRPVISVEVPTNINSLQVKSDLSLNVTWINDDQEYVAEEPP